MVVLVSDSSKFLYENELLLCNDVNVDMTWKIHEIWQHGRRVCLMEIDAVEDMCVTKKEINPT